MIYTSYNFHDIKYNTIYNNTMTFNTTIWRENNISQPLSLVSRGKYIFLMI